MSREENTQIYIDSRSSDADEYSIPHDMIEMPLILLDGEDFEDAICSVIAYVTNDCISTGIRQVRFICEASGDVMMKDITITEYSAA